MATKRKRTATTSSSSRAALTDPSVDYARVAHAPARLDLARVDDIAAKALAAVDESSRTQIAALEALRALTDACDASGVLVREVRRLWDERKASFASFQLERAARASDRVTLVGDVAREEAVRIVADALLLVEHLDANSADARTLRFRVDSLKRGNSGKPVPFFARYLEHQRR